jgi:dienelactone hydrolase
MKVGGERGPCNSFSVALLQLNLISIALLYQALPSSHAFLLPAYSEHRRTMPLRALESQTTSTCSSQEKQWSSLDPESLVATKCLIEQTLCTGKIQLAKNVEYATSILDAWQEEQQQQQQQQQDGKLLWQVEYKPVVYKEDNNTDATSLHGYMIRKRSDETSIARLPVVLFFHTGAGPHDLFLLWKAASLVQSSLDCVVFIADLLGDECGWAWGDDNNEDSRNRFLQAKNQLLAVDEKKTRRPVLQQRIHAAMDYIKQQENVNIDKCAALGWCLGGHAILELARMQRSNLLAMATFHGVFDELPAPAPQQTTPATPTTEVLICHGVNDPFVSPLQIERALETMQNLDHRVSLLQLNAKHGFSNPAQAFNKNPAFEYNLDAANKAWRQTTALLNRALTVT